jgi:hypothetical protein
MGEDFSENDKFHSKKLLRLRIKALGLQIFKPVCIIIQHSVHSELCVFRNSLTKNFSVTL